MTQHIAGLLHPGAMGCTVGKCMVDGGHRVVWAGSGRSTESHKRASDAGLEDVGNLEQVTAQCTLIFSVCPPHAAIDTAKEVADAGFAGLYVDANAISTDSTTTIQSIIESAGATFIDGGIIGPPAHKAGNTRLYLAGSACDTVTPLMSDGLLPAIKVSERIGDASALKMAYAAYTKGHSALLLLSRALAKANGIEQSLLDEWALSQPQLASCCEGEGRTAAKKAWRFSGEMREIASTMQSANLPDQFHIGAAELYERLSEFRQGSELPGVDQIMAKLAAAPDSGSG